MRIFLTPLGKKKREVSKKTILTFNEEVRKIVSEKKLKNFFEVLEDVVELIDQKEIFKSPALK